MKHTIKNRNIKVLTWMIAFLVSFLLTACSSREQGIMDDATIMNSRTESSGIGDAGAVISGNSEKDVEASSGSGKDTDISSGNEKGTDASSGGKETGTSSGDEKGTDASSGGKENGTPSGNEKDTESLGSNESHTGTNGSIGQGTEAGSGNVSSSQQENQESVPEDDLDEDGVYTSKEDVAYYLFLYGHLPSNFITKKDAEKLGWPGGSLEPYAPGMCIGGSRFGNYEGLLPAKEGRFYTECDIDTLGADKRGAKRIVFSNDGLIYYTEDHYQTFELLYGEE